MRQRAVGWWQDLGWIRADPTAGLRHRPPDELAAPLSADQVGALFRLTASLREHAFRRLLHDSGAAAAVVLATVRVGGQAARVVPVTAAYAAPAAGLAAGAGHGHLFRPGPADRGYKNFVTNFARILAADPAAPRLTSGRCRSSFICGHLAAGTPVGELLAITAICQAESLARYARHVDGAPAKAALRAWDKHRQG